MLSKHLLTWRIRSDQNWNMMVDKTIAAFHGKWDELDGENRTIGLVFFNPSLRTLTSMQVAAARLNMQSTTIIPGSGTWAFEWNKGVVMDTDKAEHIHEAISVLSLYFDVLGVRVFSTGEDYGADRNEQRFAAILKAASVPVINLESAFYHPCQALADAATLKKRFNGNPRGKKLVLSWTYHPKALPMAVANSALLMATRLGMDVTVARPDGFELDPSIMKTASRYAEAHGQTVTESSNLEMAAADADIIYAKSWGARLRYNSPEKEEALRNMHRKWRITQAIMGRTNEGALMHCLPVRRNVVVTDGVLDGSQSIHLTQAEFRLHAQVAILSQALR